MRQLYLYNIPQGPDPDYPSGWHVICSRTPQTRRFVSDEEGQPSAEAVREAAGVSPDRRPLILICASQAEASQRALAHDNASACAVPEG
jgi:hypothetical protein